MKVFVAMVIGVAIVVGIMVSASYFERPRYYIVVANRTKKWFNDVWVNFGSDIAAATGGSVPGGKASYGPVSLPIPDEALVRWTEENGLQHTLKVKLTGLVPPAPKGVDIYFIIEEDSSVTVKCIRSDDLPTSQSVGKTLVEIRNRPGIAEDLLVGTKAVNEVAGIFTKPGGVCSAQSQFDATIGNLPVTKHPDGSQSATLPDGAALTVHARKPDGGFDLNAVGIIRAKLSTGREIEIRYESFFGTK
jgi:hypothetical protein